MTAKPAEDFPVVIHHNAKCGTSRNTLAIIEAAGYKPTVINYLDTGWTRPQLLALFAAAGKSPREMLREKNWDTEALGEFDPGMTDDQILDAMIAEPVLVNRPIVATPMGVRLCRPKETVLEILDRQPPQAD